ncbi:MAG TPA: hypothetical protein VGI16_09800 [Candidatus Acidoferrum sp.]
MPGAVRQANLGICCLQLPASRRLRNLCTIFCLILICCSFPPARAQEINIDKPLINIDEDVSSFAFAPDGRIVYSVRRQFHTKQYDLERDDIWLQDAGGHRRRLLLGEKFLRGTGPFSYTVDSFRFSPNGRLILAQLMTTSVDDAGKPEEAPMTLVLDDNGKEIRIGGNDSVIKDSVNAFWLQDSSTVVVMTEAIKPRILYSFRYVNVSTGPAGQAFEGRTFLDASPVPNGNILIAVERDRNLTGPPRLQRLHLLSQDDHELATLDDYSGGISISPSGKKAAYFLDKELLEVRDLTDTTKVARLRIGFGVFQWSPDESRILLKRATMKKSSVLSWIPIPALAPQLADKSIPVAQPTPTPILFGLTYRDFAISPDGRFLAVIAPGKRNLLVFPAPH